MRYKKAHVVQKASSIWATWPHISHVTFKSFWQLCVIQDCTARQVHAARQRRQAVYCSNCGPGCACWNSAADHMAGHPRGIHCRHRRGSVQLRHATPLRLPGVCWCWSTGLLSHFSSPFSSACIPLFSPLLPTPCSALTGLQVYSSCTSTLFTNATPPPPFAGILHDWECRLWRWTGRAPHAADSAVRPTPLAHQRRVPHGSRHRTGHAR